MENRVNMLEGPITGNVIKIALPLAIISILQQLFNAADVAVVGKFASSDALAAVGANTPIINMFLTFFTGLATGATVTIASLIGAGKQEKVSEALHTVYTLSIIGGIFVIVVGELIARPLLELTDTPAEILDQATLYLRIYMVALMFAVVYNFNSAILRSKGDTKRPLYCLFASGIVNILLNLFFVIVCGLGVAGVAIATLISNIICCGATVYLLMKETDDFQLKPTGLCLKKEPLLYTIRIGLPAGVQGMLFSISNIVIQAAINSFGADCIAGNTAAMNFEFFAYFIVSAFAQTATTYYSQNYSAGKYDRCDSVYRICLALGCGVSLAASCVFFFGHDFWLGLFTSDPADLPFAMDRMLIVVLMEFLTGFNEMAAAGCRAMGVSLRPTIISICGTCIFRIIWVKTVFAVHSTVITLLMAYPVSWVLLAVAMIYLYRHVRAQKFVAT